MKRMIALLLAALLLCFSAIPALADVYTDAGFIKKIPMKAKYTEARENRGTVEKITYTCHSYAEEAENPGTEKMVEKDLYVYLPFGYNPELEYNVLYLMHGAGEDERYWLSEERMGKPTCAVLDYMMDKGEMEPTIVVASTVNIGREPGSEAVSHQYSDLGNAEQYTEVPENPTRATNLSVYPNELRNDIIPLIETRYSTFAKGDVSDSGLKASRDHRAFSGFSMGSITTENVMKDCLDIISYYGNYSAGSDNEDFFAAMASEEFKDLSISFWYHGEGSADFALEGHKQFCAAILERMSDRVTDGVNYAYVEFKGGTHAYNCWLPHMYNCLKVFFK